MLRLVEVEFRKLRGSLVLLLIALPPLDPKFQACSTRSRDAFGDILSGTQGT